MAGRNNKSRKFAKKAIEILKKVTEKYPGGIDDVSSIGDEARAWLERSVQFVRENVKYVWFLGGKPKWFEMLRSSRNNTSHQLDFSDDSKFGSLCSSFFSNVGDMLNDLQGVVPKIKTESKQKRKFENFASPKVFGSESERKQLVDAMEDMASPVEPTDIKIEFPKNDYAKIAEKTLSEALAHDNVKVYIQSHEGVSENIQTDILDWLQQTNETLEKEDPFIEEALFVAQQKKLSAVDVAKDLLRNLSNIEAHYRQLPSISDSKRGKIAPSNLDFNFYSQEFAKQQKKAGKNTSSVQWKSMEQLEVLRRNFIGDMERNLVDRKHKWEQDRIDEMRRKFLEDLYKRIQNFMRLEKVLSPFINDLGRLWDLSAGVFETSGFEILERFAKILEQDQSLQELAEILGKQNRAQSVFEKELRDKVVVKPEWHPQHAYRGETKGICYSNDISTVLPSELALMKNPATKKLFQLRFAQKQLMSFDFQRKVQRSREESVQEEVSIEKKEPKGPIIICVDTSGSMHGTPENIAKTITFALSKIAIEEERKCYLISFSTGIETLELSDFKKGDGLERLVRFLQMSFNGGTDASPALQHAVEMLQTDGYKNADVLMISDFVMGNLPSNLVDSINTEKEKNTEFYSLVIGTSGNQNTIDCFDHNWQYNTADPHASRRLVEQLHSIKTRKIETGEEQNADE